MATVLSGVGSPVASVPFSPLPVRTVFQHGISLKLHESGQIASCGWSLHFNCKYESVLASVRPLQKTHSSPITHRSQRHFDSLVCTAAALSATCAAEQTQTVTVERQTTKVTVAPVQGKEKAPDLDDGGTGFPPRDDDGGGGGGGGGGWGGGFFLFGFLGLLFLFKENEDDSKY